MLFVPDQPLHRVALREAGTCPGLMLMQPSGKVVGHAGIKRAALARGENVDPEAFLHGWIGNGMDHRIKSGDDGGEYRVRSYNHLRHAMA